MLENGSPPYGSSPLRASGAEQGGAECASFFDVLDNDGCIPFRGEKNLSGQQLFSDPVRLISIKDERMVMKDEKTNDEKTLVFCGSVCLGICRGSSCSTSLCPTQKAVLPLFG